MIRVTLATSLLLLLGGCQNAPWHQNGPEVEPGLMGYVPPSQRSDIDQARNLRDQVREDVAVARRDLDQLQGRIDLARKDQQAIVARVTEAQNQIKHAREYGTDQELNAATQKLDQAQAADRLASAKFDYYDNARQLAQQRVALKEKELQLANAEIELRKADAVSKLDRPRAKQIDVDKFQKRVAQLQNDVQKAQIDVDAQLQSVRYRADQVAQLSQQVPQEFQTNQLEPIDQLFTKLESDGHVLPATMEGQGIQNAMNGMGGAPNNASGNQQPPATPPGGAMPPQGNEPPPPQNPNR